MGSHSSDGSVPIEQSLYEPSGCVHRGAFIGIASCGTGKVYVCTKFGKWCGNKQPIDEWVSLLKRELSPANYQCCKKCNSFKAKDDHSQT
jgi:hypothetical protein